MANMNDTESVQVNPIRFGHCGNIKPVIINADSDFYRAQVQVATEGAASLSSHFEELAERSSVVAEALASLVSEFDEMAERARSLGVDPPSDFWPASLDEPELLGLHSGNWERIRAYRMWAEPVSSPSLDEEADGFLDYRRAISDDEPTIEEAWAVLMARKQRRKQ